MIPRRCLVNRSRGIMLDGITLELLWRRLTSIVDDAVAALVRTSFSIPTDRLRTRSTPQ
jgi:hypothetical protein